MVSKDGAEDSGVSSDRADASSSSATGNIGELGTDYERCMRDV